MERRSEHVVSRSCSPYSAPVSDVSHAGVVARVGARSVPHSRGVAGQVSRRGGGRRVENVVGG